MDLPSLRGMNKSAKSKPSKKPVAQAKGAAGKTTPVAAVKRKTPAAATAAPVPSPTTVKRSIKPFKSRMMDDAPAFVDQDFEEIDE